MKLKTKRGFTPYHFFSQKSDKGFIALMSVSIISAILLILLFTLGASSFFSRFDALDTESKRESLALAESCANVAMLKLARDVTYQPVSGGDCVSVDDTCPSGPKVCKICQIVPGAGASKIIFTRAVFSGAYTNLSVTFDPTPSVLTVSRWGELPNYSGPSCPVPQ